MKKCCIILSLCMILLFSGCTEDANRKYQRISFNQETLGEVLTHINEDTVVINTVNTVFTTQLPIYEITPHNISQQEFNEIVNALQLPGDADDLEYEGNRFTYNLVGFMDHSRGYYDMTDEELEKAAWEVLNKIPLLKGEFEYLGIKRTMTVIDSEGEHITRAGAQFQLLLDGVRVSGDEDIVFYFDGSGLVEIQIRWFDYKQIGTMDLVPLENAEAKVKTPDDFNLDVQEGLAQTLQIEQTKLLLVNQYNSGCTILQPIYSFIGTATMTDGTQSDFSSKIIAIPESYTYEAK